jgi:hypothetical protein
MVATGGVVDRAVQPWLPLLNAKISAVGKFQSAKLAGSELVCVNDTKGSAEAKVS